MQPVDWIRRLQAIAQIGLTYAGNVYDRERYEELKRVSAELAGHLGRRSPAEILAAWDVENGYATPKVDVRGGVFVDDKILLVREVSDGHWTLPGGWADLNDSPSEAIEREVWEEAGYKAKAVKLAAVLDRAKHAHPPMLHHVYKMFFLCNLVDSNAYSAGHETDAVDFFALDELPPLSAARVTAEQIRLLFDHHRNPALPAAFD